MADPSDNVELRKGLVLGGKYRLEKEIGRGAMGTVWSAVHESLHQRVAVKVISREHADSDDLRRRFDTEARAAAKLRSRFVVSVSDNGETAGGLPYIVMEYLEGECLEDRIARYGRLPLSETTRVVHHVMRALSKAHARGIVHRDLKPANIFISKSDDEDHGDDWIAKVLDFGVAKMDDYGDRSATKTGTVLGTPLFMAPEQVRGASSVDGRADLYSLGMVVYNMLTGSFAFEGQSFGDLLVSICTEPLPDLTRDAPHLPPALDTWFKRACARNPDERYQTAKDFFTGFTAAIGEEGMHSSRVSSDVGSSSLGDAPRPPVPLAETFAAHDTANAGTPAAAATVPATKSPARDSSGAGTSAVTVNEPPAQKSNLLWMGLAALGVLGVGALLFLMQGSDPNGTGPESIAATALPDAPAPPVPEGPSPGDVIDPRLADSSPEKSEPLSAPTEEPPTQNGDSPSAAHALEQDPDRTGTLAVPPAAAQPTTSLATSGGSATSRAPTKGSAAGKSPRTAPRPKTQPLPRAAPPPTPSPSSQPDLGF